MKQVNKTKLLIAFIYSLLAAVALNIFWLPGNIYANGITGMSQLLVQLLHQHFVIEISIPTMVLLVNIPLLVIAWCKIDRRFTLYTIFAVVLTSLIMRLVPVVPLTSDPLICAVFGGVIHGTSVGITLNSDFSTGGLDILGILIKKVTDRSIGSFFIAFNVTLQFFAGLFYGWEYAFYSSIAVFISGRVVDYVNAKQRRVQLLIVTEHSAHVTQRLQTNLASGITVIHGVEGAFDHQEKKMLMMVVPQRELKTVKELILHADQRAFVSEASGIQTNRAFYEW